MARKFNGKIVGDLTGLTGKELGRFIWAFKGKRGGDLDGMDCGAVAQAIKEEFEADMGMG